MIRIDPLIEQAVDRMIAITQKADYPKTIKAGDCKPGTYLLSGMFYKVEVIRVNKIAEDNTCTSVSVTFEHTPFMTITISGDTELIPYSEEYHKLYHPKKKEKKEKLLSNKERRIVQKREHIDTKIKEERASKIPRSSIIDVELSKVTDGKVPDWNKIADAVIAGGAAEEEARKSIINQSKQRHKWYTVEGKQNPVLKV